MKIDPDKLEARVSYWRKLLQLESMWAITTKIVEHDTDLAEDMRGSSATCNVDSAYYQADIIFCEENITDTADLELTVCHELLHIVFDPLEIAATSSLGESHDKLSNMLVESTIERISRAFIALAKRKKRGD